MPQRLREIELARRIQTGDEAAFSEFAELFGSRLMHYSLVLCRHREDAEEVVQDTLLRLHDRVSDLRDAERVRPWAFRVAKNVCLMKRRGRHVEVHLQPGDLWHMQEASSMSPHQMETLASMREAMAAMSAPMRMTFLLRAVEGLSTAETAEALEISADAVKNRMRRARRILRESISGVIR